MKKNTNLGIFKKKKKMHFFFTQLLLKSNANTNLQEKTDCIEGEQNEKTELRLEPFSIK